MGRWSAMPLGDGVAERVGRKGLSPVQIVNLPLLPDGRFRGMMYFRIRRSTVKERHMRQSASKILAILLAALPLTAQAETAPNAPSLSEEESVAVCPDGGFEGGCSQADVDRAITLAPDFLMTLRSRCLYQTAARCWPIANGTIGAMERGGPLLWQHMLLAPSDGPATEMIVLLEARSAGAPQLIAAEQVAGYFGAPNMVQNSDEGVLIHVPGRFGGSGAGNADLLLLRTKEGWSRIALEGWFDDVNHLLPDGFEIRQGVAFDFREMFAVSPVWRAGDGNCCGTGGTVKIDFSIDANRLAVRGIGFDQTQPVGRTQYIERAQP